MKATKARTRSARVSAKRGRPPKQGVAREPNGRVSRTLEPASKLALEVRARRLDLSMEDAKSQEAGSWMGYLHLTFVRWEKIGKPKDIPQPVLSLRTSAYHALLSAQAAHNDYLKAIAAPGAYYEPIFGAQGDEEAHANWCSHARKKWKAIQDAIHEAQEQDRTSNLWAALDYVVLREMEVPHMITSVRSLGNCLSRHFQKA